MTVDINSKDGQIIRQLIPLSTLPLDQFQSLCNQITIETIETDQFLFNREDTVTDLIYLINGTITLQSEQLKIEKIESGSESARFAIAHQIPRKIDAYTNTSVRFLRIKTAIISALSSTSYQEDTSYMVFDEPEDENNDDDWMTTLLKSPIFRVLPPANLQQIIMSLEEIHFKKGERIINQGDEGDYYYIIKQGHCLLSRKPSPNAKEIKLAQLRTQDTFGEDSLLSGAPRNVSISALTDMTLLRLNKEKFIRLIKEPALKFINYDQLAAELEKGAILLDVRISDEYNQQHLPNSINAPFFSLRMQLKILDKKKTIIVVCEDGKTSEAAAFLLLRHKLNAIILKGGMKQLPEGATLISSETANETIAPLAKISADDIQPPIESSQSNQLQQENQQLKQMIQTLTEEKQALEKKYRILFKQTEKLKAVLDSLKKK